MPYINEEDREKFDEFVTILAAMINQKGELNYVICEIVGRLILKTKVGYTQISEWIDTLPDAEAELRRRLLAPYENVKIHDNGDVPSFTRILNVIHEMEPRGPMP